MLSEADWMRNRGRTIADHTDRAASMDIPRFPMYNPGLSLARSLRLGRIWP